MPRRLPPFFLFCLVITIVLFFPEFSRSLPWIAVILDVVILFTFSKMVEYSDPKKVPKMLSLVNMLSTFAVLGLGVYAVCVLLFSL